MSMGYGAFSRKVLEDDTIVIYEYGSFDLNVPEYRNEDHIYDGLIMIDKDCFIEPEIHEKIKRFPSGRKRLVVKRVIRDVDFGEYIDNGKIKIENCSYTWHLMGENKDIDEMALRLLYYLFQEYQEIGKIPEKLSLCY